MPKKPVIKIILITAMIALLFTYFFDQQTSTAPVKNITLGIAQEPLAALAIIANKKGYFMEQGVNITVKPYKGGKQALVNGILTGEVDMATTADVPFVFNTFQRNDFKLIASIATSDNEPRIVARKNKGISQPSDLADKRIITKEGSAVHFFLNVFLSYSRLSEEQIDLSFTKNGHEMVALLASGEVDAFSHREPFISEAKGLLGDEIIIFEKPGAYTKTFNLVATNDVINKKPVAIKRVLKALLMAEKYVNESPTDAIKLVANFMGSSEKAIADTWDSIDLKVSLEQTLLTTLKAQALWVLSNHLTNASKAPNYLEHIDATFLQTERPESVNINTTPSK